MKNPIGEKKSAYSKIGGDLQDLKRGAKQNLEDGAVTPSYEGDVETAIELLSEVLATETVCALRYRQNAIVAQGMNYKPVAEEFWEHAKEEQHHADQVAERIQQLGGTPHLNPDELLKLSHSDYVESNSLEEMIRGNLISERIAIDSYRALIRYFADKDPTTRRLLEDILAKEEEHADDLLNFIQEEVPARKKMIA